MEITSKKVGIKGVIYIDGMAHIIIDLLNVWSMQSWIDYDASKVDRYKIEVIVCGNRLLLEYNDATKWKEIVQELEALITSIV